MNLGFHYKGNGWQVGWISVNSDLIMKHFLLIVVYIFLSFFST